MSERILNIPAKPFYLVRHGESHGNRLHYPTGSMDTRLTRLGRQQADETAAIIAGLDDQPDILISSTLVRARHTAAAIAREIKKPMRVDRLLCEQHYGDYQGLHKTKVHAESGAEWWRNPKAGESFDRFTTRVVGRLAHWLNRPGLPMFVAHGGVFSAFAAAYGHDLRNIPNAGAFLFDPSVEHGKIIWTLHRLDEQGSSIYAEL